METNPDNSPVSIDLKTVLHLDWSLDFGDKMWYWESQKVNSIMKLDIKLCI